LPVRAVLADLGKPMKVVVATFLALMMFAAPARAVGFKHVLVPGPDHEMFEVGIWYPSNAAPSPKPAGPFTQQVATDGVVEGKGLPLIVISHGGGGAYFAHYDTALALAQAGFVVAALTHPGDNNRDEAKFIEAPVNWPRDVSRLLDYMLAAWPEHDRVDPNRIASEQPSIAPIIVAAIRLRSAANRWPDDARLSDIEPRFICGALW
jgi:predicted dienelactone hydrolase